VLPTVPTKYLDTVVHGAIAAVDSALERYDAVLVCNAINAATSWIPRISGKTRVVLNVDGLERNRRKWSAAGRGAYRVSERLSTIVPDAVVSDARVIQEYYRQRYGFETVFIPYGGDLPDPAGTEALARLGLAPEKYVLYVSRLEPENNALEVVQAYRQVPGQTPLVVVGDAPYAPKYIARVRAAADPRVLFPGAIYGDGYRQLLSHAAVYIQATEIGGTHPALVEACGLLPPIPRKRRGGERRGFCVRHPTTRIARSAPGRGPGRSGPAVRMERAGESTHKRTVLLGRCRGPVRGRS
jgi:glycosyltransferase involved in cell wall biosynthesis